MTKFSSFCLTIGLLLCPASRLQAAKLAEVRILDREYLVVHILDGKVTHKDDAKGVGAFQAHHHEKDQDTVQLFAPALNTGAAAVAGNWKLRSHEDSDFGTEGKMVQASHRKSKVNGHAEMEWSGSDYQYSYTHEHFIYLHLPHALKQGRNYTLMLAHGLGVDQEEVPFTFDIFSSITEALHVNLAGYVSKTPVKKADLYHWMGDGGARDYRDFEGNKVYLHNIATKQSHDVGTVGFWKKSGADVAGYNLTRSDVWKADVVGFTTPGTYRLAVEGIGCSPEFGIQDDIYAYPFRISVQGFFYMRIGQDSTGVRPVPRRPLWIQDQDPPDTKVYLTTMHPFHAQWSSIPSDQWDKPDLWIPFKKPGSPTNPRARGGHSDALDWDRHLGHVSIIWDLLLPYFLTDGAPDDDDLGIAESGNGIPDLLDEARNEVDFWLDLRDGQGYAHGLTNPNKNNELFQAGATAIAGWANAANAAMMADAFRIAGNTELMAEYRDSALAAYAHASGLADPMLDKSQNIGEANIRGRDLKMMAAAHLFNVTGEQKYESVIKEESVCTGPRSVLDDYGSGNSLNQTWATAAYLKSPRSISYPELRENMISSLIHQSGRNEIGYLDKRPSRRITSQPAGYFRTIQNVHRTLIAHAVMEDSQNRTLFLEGLYAEADYGLGRNPMNRIHMTTAGTALAHKRSVEGAYTSGRNDGSPGLHPGHTPYMNLDDWFCGMTMGCPSRLHDKSYPAGFKANWPVGEGYFNTRYVWAHNEFTPQQTMRGKMALYGYLHGLTKNPGASRVNPRLHKLNSKLKGRFLELPGAEAYRVHLLDLRGKVVWSGRTSVQGDVSRIELPRRNGVVILHVASKSGSSTLRATVGLP